MKTKKVLASILALCMLVSTIGTTAFAAEGDAAAVGEDTYAALADAVAAANAQGTATVVLSGDLELGEKLTITGDVTIQGAHTITRAQGYTGTLFAVNAGASLTLDGGLTIDGANDWSFDQSAYDADRETFANVPKADAEKYFTPEEGAPVASAYMMTVSGTLNLKDVTVKNHYSIGSGIVSAAAGSTVNLDGAYITHNAATQASGLVVNASGGKWDTTPVIQVNMEDGTVIDGNHVGGNHGIFKVYMGTVFTMNGGQIKNTTGWNSNGVAVGVYWATFNMNGGEICSNSSVNGPNNGRCAPVYLHSSHIFSMTGGSICHNEGGSRSGLDAPYDNGTASIAGGSVIDNTSYYYENGFEGYDPDLNATASLVISGGTFTQDVARWLDSTHGLAYDEQSGMYTVVESVAQVSGTAYASIAAAVAAANDGDTITLTASCRLGETVAIDKDVTLDLNGCTVYAEDAAAPAMRILADVTVKNGTVDARGADSYAFIVGASDASVEGNLTIESGTYYAATTAASVTKGTLTVNGGKFRINPYTSEGAEPNYNFLLNCIDGNYKDGTAGILVNGGSFYSFDPSSNAAEGANTSFVADGAVVVYNDEEDLYTVSGSRAIWLAPSKDTVKTNQEFTVAVNISGVQARGAMWTLGFDEEYFELVSLETSYKQYNKDKLAPQIIAETGTIDTAGPVATYTFKSKAQAVTDSAFELTNVDIRTIVDAWEGTDVSATIGIENTNVTVELSQYEDVTVKYDGEATQDAAIADECDGADHTFEVTTSTQGANITYTVNGGAETATAPVIKDAGTYTITYKIDGVAGYEPVENTVTVTMNKPDYVVEVAFGEDSDYVDGTKLVLVYTNAENVSFDFNRVKMFDVSAAGYKYNDTQEYAHVYALVVNALAANTLSAYEAKVTPDYANAAPVINYEPNNDINFKDNVTWDDIMAAYSVIEKDEYAFNNQMAGFIKADTNRDKHARSSDANPIITEVYGE